VCDWKTPLAADVLLSRHYPGDGVIDFASLTRAVEATGYDRDIEVEIFNEEIWATEPLEAVRRTAAGFAAAVSPHLLESRSWPTPPNPRAPMLCAPAPSPSMTWRAKPGCRWRPPPAR